MGVLGRSGRRMSIVDGGPALVLVPAPVPVLVWYAKRDGDALLTRITRTLDRTSYIPCFSLGFVESGFSNGLNLKLYNRVLMSFA